MYIAMVFLPSKRKWNRNIDPKKHNFNNKKKIVYKYKKKLFSFFVNKIKKKRIWVKQKTHTQKKLY